MSTTSLRPIGLHPFARPSPSLGPRMSRWFGLVPARPLTRNEEAAAVRAMAVRLQDSQAGFASDLFAAADRHELLG